jgi:hypothetical protein
MRNIERFRRAKHYTIEIDPSTATTLLLSSTVIGNVSGQALGANFEATIWASSAAIFLGFTSGVTTTSGFELGTGQSINIMIKEAIYGRITNSATGKFKAIVWD